QINGCLSIMDYRANFLSITDNVSVFQQPVNIIFVKLCHYVWIKVDECCPKSRSFFQNSQPRQSGLKALQAKSLQLALLIIDWSAPLSVKILLQKWMLYRP